MRIYRVLEKSEYNCFLEQQSIFNPKQHWFVIQRMLFPENFDKFGKFFFFELEDAFQFARFYDNCSTEDMILEIDIDKETAFKYLSVANYSYPDPQKGKHNVDHNIPELYLNYSVVGEKIKRGEFRLINPILELKGFPKKIYESNRTSSLVELGNTLDKIMSLQESLSRNRIWSFEICEYKELGITELKKKKTDEIISDNKAKSIKNQLNSIAKGKFNEFVRDHEKYMALVPVAERQLN